MIIYRARVFDTPDSPFTGGRLRSESDIALVVDDGLITARTDLPTARPPIPTPRSSICAPACSFPG